MQKKIIHYFYMGSISLVALATLVLVVASPFALSTLERIRVNWALLSNIGQTYGAVSALLAALGISGVVATIVLQIRESRRSRVDAIRSHHYDLYRMAIEDPILAETSYSVAQLPSLKDRKQTIYINLQIEFWLMLWEIDNLPESTLRGYAADLFYGEAGRRYWENFGVSRVTLATGARKERRFFQVINEEFLRLDTTREEPSRDVTRSTRNKVLPTVIAGAVVVIAAGTAASRAIKLRNRTHIDW